MMTSETGIIFRLTGRMCGEFTGHRLNPLTKASDTELCCLLWSSPEQKVGSTIETPVIWYLRRHRAHYDVTVMKQNQISTKPLTYLMWWTAFSFHAYRQIVPKELYFPSITYTGSLKTYKIATWRKIPDIIYLDFSCSNLKANPMP